MGNTYRQLINVFRARAENRYAQFIHEAPQVGRVVERAAVVQNERAAHGEPTYKEVPHHPSADRRSISADVHMELQTCTDVVV